MVYATGRGDTMRTGEGTMVVGGGRSGSRGTMVVDADSGAAGNTPAYMVYLREQNARAQQRASDAAQAQRGASRKWADEEEEDQASFIDSDATLRVHRDESPEITAARKGLRRRLRDLDEQYREEAQSLRTAYEQQRQTILDVLETL